MTGGVLSLEFTGKETIRATVLGEKPYAVNITSGPGRVFHCTCPSFEEDGFCKHCVAVILAAEPGVPFQAICPHDGKRFLNRVSRTSEKVCPNPGLELLELRPEEDLDSMNGVYTWGQYRYRWTSPNGVTLWGGDSAEALLKAFDTLRMKEGHHLGGYYYCESAGGNFAPFSLPADRAMPDWQNSSCPIFGSEDVPPGIDPNIEIYILTDPSAKSYFQKSIFLREIRTLGAYWHGESDWTSSGLIWDESQVRARMETPTGMPVPKSKPLPGCLLPRVSYLANRSVEVTFYFFSEGLGAIRGLFKYTDRHLPDGTVHMLRKCLINLGPGPIP
jgi:hypothetical protein